MKRIYIILLFTSLILGSCAKEQREDNTTLDQSTIGFWSYVGSSTRATDRIDTNFLSFSVTAYTVGDDGYLESLHIPKTTISRTKILSDAWVIEDGSTYYWPLTTPLNFFAFYPTDTTPFVEMADSDDDPYIPSIDYTNDFFAVNQPDMIAACELNQTKDEAAIVSSPVNLTFSHIMTKLNFSIKGKDEHLTYHVTEIKINAHHMGEFFFDLGNNDNSRINTDIDDSTTSSSIGWWEVYAAENLTETQTSDQVNNLVIYSDGTTSADTADGIPADNREFIYFQNEDDPMIVGPDSESGELEMTLDSEYSFMMIPQTLPSNAEISVTYYITYNSFTISEEITRTISLDGIVWEMGSNLLYRLTLPTLEVTEIELKVNSLIGWTLDAIYTIYTGPITVTSLVLNDYYEEATFDEEDAGLILGLEIEDYNDEDEYDEKDEGGIGDIIVNEYSDRDESDESEAGVVGDVMLDPYGDNTDYGEDDAGVVGDVIVNDYSDEDVSDESEGGVVGDVTVEDYGDNTDYGEDDAGVVGDVTVNDYSDKSESDESEGGVVGDVTVEDYGDTKDYGEDDAGVVGDTTVNDYNTETQLDESDGGVVSGVDVEDYTEEQDYTKEDATSSSSTEVNDYTSQEVLDEDDSGVVSGTDIEGYTEEKDYTEEDATSSSSTEVNDYSEKKTQDLDSATTTTTTTTTTTDNK